MDRSELVLWVAYGLAFAAVFTVVKLLLQEQESLTAQENLEDQGSRKSSHPLVRLLRPIFRQYVVPIIRGKKFWENQRLKNRRKLIAAGLKEELTPEEWIAFKFTLVGFFPAVLFVLRTLGFMDLSGLILVASAGAGWFYPDIWVRGRIQSRHKQVRKALPFVVDLLALSTEAGLDFIASMNKVVEKSAPSPLIEELGQVLKEIQVGSSRAEALHEMANRIDMTEVSSFVAVLVSADQMGASIGKILRQQSDQIRTQRFLAAEKAGALASQQIILPIILFMFPAVLLIIMGPLVLSFILGGGNTP